MNSATDGATLVNRLNAIHEPIVVDSLRTSSSEVPRWWLSSTAILFLVILGTVLRGCAWFNDRNLWIDESMLALNLIERSPVRLLEPLDWNQGAPVGFLLASKGVIGVLGISERSLRLLPLVGSCLGLLGVAWLAPRMLPRPAAMFALALFSVSPFLISYSAECKQYATDAAIAIGLFAAAVELINGAGGARRWGILALAGAVAVWFSHPAAFVLGGLGGALIIESLLRKDRTRFLAAAATAACWLASFGLCYFLFLRNLGGNQYLLDYWTGHFLPVPKSPGDLAWLLDHFFAPFAYPGGLGGTEIRAGGIAAAFFLIGILGLVKSNRPVAMALILPGLLTLLASGLHKYPFAGRLLLFLAPLMILGAAHGAHLVASTLFRSQPTAAIVMLGILLAAPCLETYQELRHPMRLEQIESALAKLRQEWRPGDRIYVYYGAIPAFQYYTREAPFPADSIVWGSEHRGKPLEYRSHLAAFQGQPRVWLVFSHAHGDEKAIIRAYAEGLGRCERTIRGPGVEVCLFNFAEVPESRP